MKCKGCELEHSPLIRCDVARRMLEKGGQVSEVTARGTPCPVCEARRVRQREKMRAYRAKHGR